MSYQYQLSDAKNSSLKNVAGVCTTSQDFIDAVNEAQRRLMRRGDWFDTQWLVSLCIDSACITWPRYLKTIHGARIGNCCGATVDVKSRWYNIVGPFSGSNFGGSVTISDIGTTPCYRKIASSTGSYLRYYVVKHNDIGKTIRIFGKKYGGQPLQELSNGAWVDGVTLTADTPYVQGTDFVTEITAVTREATEGMSYLYELNSTTNLLRDLAAYEPNETNPRYRQSKIHNYSSICGETGSDGVERKHLEVLAKLAFIPAQSDTDFLLIDNFEALKFMVQAIKAEEANDEKLAEIKIAKAIREMNFEERDNFPDRQTSVLMDANFGRTLRNPI